MYKTYITIYLEQVRKHTSRSGSVVFIACSTVSLTFENQVRAFSRSWLLTFCYRKVKGADTRKAAAWFQVTLCPLLVTHEQAPLSVCTKCSEWNTPVCKNVSFILSKSLRRQIAVLAEVVRYRARSTYDTVLKVPDCSLTPV
jgi:hypothetical protein